MESTSFAKWKPFYCFFASLLQIVELICCVANYLGRYLPSKLHPCSGIHQLTITQCQCSSYNLRFKTNGIFLQLACLQIRKNKVIACQRALLLRECIQNKIMRDVLCRKLTLQASTNLRSIADWSITFVASCGVLDKHEPNLRIYYVRIIKFN